MNTLSSPLLRAWLPIAVTLVFAVGFVYVGVQQNIRTVANDPQIQIAEDTAAAVASGASPTSVVPTAQVDIGASLTPFVAVFDGSNEVMASSARLDNGIPTPPTGVLDYARSHGSNRLTWQPKAGVRIALVLEKAGTTSMVVAVGRSLRESETRVAQLEVNLLIGLLVSLAATYGLTMMVQRQAAK